MYALYLISVSGTPKALEKLEELIDSLVMDATMDLKIDGLTTEVIRGARADAAREAARTAKPARPAKKGK